MSPASKYPEAGFPRDLTKYVYGTTRLGDDAIPFTDRVEMAREAMKSGAWFHTSDAYGNALEVLGTAFEQNRTRAPKTIIKIGWTNIAELRATIQKNIAPLGVDQ